MLKAVRGTTQVPCLLSISRMVEHSDYFALHLSKRCLNLNPPCKLSMA